MRYGSPVAQLENDQLIENQGDDLEQAYRRGHNAAVMLSLHSLRAGEAPSLDFVSEHQGDAELRAYCRGRNAGVRHVQHVLQAHRMDAALRELAHAPAVRTVVLFTAEPTQPDAPDLSRAVINFGEKP